MGYTISEYTVYTYTHTHTWRSGKTLVQVERRSYTATGHRFEPCSWRGYSDILWISFLDWITDPERVSNTD